MQTESPSWPIYTAISFSPVQSFIEKSRKLRDLYGSSQILSYLSHAIIHKATQKPFRLKLVQPNVELLTQPTINVQRGIPNRIVFKGDIKRDAAKILLRDSWNKILDVCRRWIEDSVYSPEHYHWAQEWIRWRDYTWELFWGQGENPDKANHDLNTRKLKRDWVAINWTGESSSLTGTDAIAWQHLGDPSIKPDQILNDLKKKKLEEFYFLLAQRSENCSTDKQPEGKFIAANERLSIPELVKRLVNLEEIARPLQMPILEEGFTRLQRKPEFKDGTLIPGQWTGWFMGDGDKMGTYLKEIYEQLGDEGLETVSKKLLEWGNRFQRDFPKSQQNQKINHFGRIVYAGGDDFLGLIYGLDPHNPIPANHAFEWLITLPGEWDKQNLPKVQNYPKAGDYQSPSVSVGFVWAGHSVPQRDILQHCREAEKRAKNLGRNRTTIRIVFNNGQYVQWTCPWDKLNILKQYVDRDGKSGNQANWTHLYTDWHQLKTRHAIRFIETESQRLDARDRNLAVKFLDLYFKDAGSQIENEPNPERRWNYITGNTRGETLAIVNWIDDLVKVGWQLCSNT